MTTRYLPMTEEEIIHEADSLLSQYTGTSFPMTDWIAGENARRAAAERDFRVADVMVGETVLKVGNWYDITYGHRSIPRRGLVFLGREHYTGWSGTYVRFLFDHVGVGNNVSRLASSETMFKTATEITPNVKQLKAYEDHQAEQKRWAEADAKRRQEWNERQQIES